jgi:hypothetical protein
MKVDACSIYLETNWNPGAAAALVGQVGNLRRVGNPPASHLRCSR